METGAWASYLSLPRKAPYQMIEFGMKTLLIEQIQIHWVAVIEDCRFQINNMKNMILLPIKLPFRPPKKVCLLDLLN